LASWSGLCPGNNESAGKRLSGKARNGNVWLRRNLCQAAWAASHTKNTYLSTKFRRLAARKGKKRAIVAVAHTIVGDHLKTQFSEFQPVRESDIIAPKAQSSVRSSCAAGATGDGIIPGWRMRLLTATVSFG
jgi:Transposase IS116/IS110/IS902 family